MRTETKALLEKAKQSIQAAANLRRDGFLDFAASRAYYAMFYIAQALLIEQGLSYSSHSGAISAFGKEFARTGRMDTRFHRYHIDA
ncbi:MAG: HEPN domain-containing protein [Anaerolineales bacterium]